MIARRARLVVALVLLLSMALVGTAHAAGTGRITSPSSGATVTSPVPVTIEVTGDTAGVFSRPDHVVQVRLADHTGATPAEGTESVAATCSSDCDSDSTWTTPAFDPATLAPFGSAPSCNGGYTVQVRVDEGPWTGNAIRISRAPAAPTGVALAVEDGDVTVTWDAAATPDAVGYVVQRRVDGGSWSSLADPAGQRPRLHRRRRRPRRARVPRRHPTGRRAGRRPSRRTLQRRRGRPGHAVGPGGNDRP